MTPFNSNSESLSETEKLLGQPEKWLPLLAHGEGAEFFFFTLDQNRNLKYLSDSVWLICKVRREEWMHQSFPTFLTDHSWNASLLKSDAKLDAGKVHRINIEVWNFERSRVKLETWHRVILWNGEPFGSVGMAKLYHDPIRQESQMGSVDPLEINQRISTLTRREIEVVELVVRGELNKSIAKKLDIAMRTVEARRSKAMLKLGVKRLSDLIRIWILAKESPQSDAEPR